MTNPEQTLREKLAEVRFRQMRGVGPDDVLRAEPILVQEHIYEEVDMYLDAVREWLGQSLGGQHD